MLGRCACFCKPQMYWKAGMKGNTLDNVLKAAVSTQGKTALLGFPVNNQEFILIGRRT